MNQLIKKYQTEIQINTIYHCTENRSWQGDLICFFDRITSLDSSDNFKVAIYLEFHTIVAFIPRNNKKSSTMTYS